MNKQKILVVDDETSIVEFIEINLKRSGYDVLKAYNGSEGLLLLESEKPDLMVLDLMLPDMSGFDVCKKARLFSDVPIIILTAKGDDYDTIYLVLPVEAKVVWKHVHIPVHRHVLHRNKPSKQRV